MALGSVPRPLLQHHWVMQSDVQTFNRTFYHDLALLFIFILHGIVQFKEALTRFIDQVLSHHLHR